MPLFAPRRIRSSATAPTDTNADDLLIDVPFGELRNLDAAASPPRPLADRRRDATPTITLIALGENAVRRPVPLRAEPAARSTGSSDDTVTRHVHRRLARSAAPRACSRRRHATPVAGGTFIDVAVDRDRRRPRSTRQPRQRRDRARRRRATAAIVADARPRRRVLADGSTVRYYLTGTFAEGQVTVDFVDGSWKTWPATAASPAAAASSSIERSSRQPTRSTSVFFIDIRGGMELRLADLFDEPIIEIRGKVALEIGDATRRRRRRSRFARRLGHDQGDQARQHRVRRGVVRAREAATALDRPRVLGRRGIRHELRLPRAVRHLPAGQRAAADQRDRPRCRTRRSRSRASRAATAFLAAASTRRASAADAARSARSRAAAGWRSARRRRARTATSTSRRTPTIGSDAQHRPEPEAAPTSRRVDCRRTRRSRASSPARSGGSRRRRARSSSSRRDADRRHRGLGRPRRGAHLRARAALVRVRDRRRRPDRRPEHAQRPKATDEVVQLTAGSPSRSAPRRFEFFVTAGGCITPLGPSGRITGLLSSTRPARRRPAPGYDATHRASPACSLEIDALLGPAARASTGIDGSSRSRPRADHVQHDAARAGVQRAGVVPRRPAGRLPAADQDLQVGAALDRHGGGEPGATARCTSRR